MTATTEQKAAALRVADVLDRGCDRCEPGDLQLLEEAGLVERCVAEHPSDTVQVGETIFCFTDVGENLVSELKATLPVLAAAFRQSGEQLQKIAIAMAVQGICILEMDEPRGADMVETAHDIGVIGRGCIADAMEAEGKERPPSSWIDPGPERGGKQWSPDAKPAPTPDDDGAFVGEVG